MKAAIPYLVAAAAIAAMIWAMSFGSPPPADFTFCNGEEIKTVAPARVTGAPEGRIIRSLFEGLTRWNAETLKPEPGMAESWDISEDKRTYTFHIRRGAVWSDGTPVTAHDFVWSWRRFLHPEIGAEYANEMWYIVGSKKFTSGKVEVGDPVEVELKEKAEGGPEHAAGIIASGKLVAIEDHEDGTIYTVEIDGRARRFQENAAVEGTEAYNWLIYDFRQVGIHALDERTLEVTLKHPVPYFLNLVGFYPMSPVNRACVERHGYPAWTKPENIVCNGAFQLEFRRIRDRIRLRKNPLYWDARNVKLETVDALAIKSDTTMLNLYMTGEADWITTVPNTVISKLAKRPQGDFAPAPYLATYHYIINVTRPPLDDARVRRALTLALDREQIVRDVTQAGQIPGRSMTPLEIRKYIDYDPPQCGKRNVKEAKRLLAEAGYPEGRGLGKVEILYNTSEGHQTIAEVIQAQWKDALGINVGLRNQEWTAYLDSRQKKQYQVCRAGWIGDYVDPNTFLNLFVSDGPQNHTGWSNQEYDELVKKARGEPDDKKRLDYFRRAERILMDELPVIPIYFYVSTSMVRPYVKGWYPNIQDVHPLRAIWIDRQQKARVFKEEGLR